MSLVDYKKNFSYLMNSQNMFIEGETFLKELALSIYPEITLVSSFYNEEGNVKRFWSQIKKLDNLLNIEEIIFINNASSDNTLKFLKKIEKKDLRVIVLSNKFPTCYSEGFAKGVKNSKSKYTLITHSDCEFNLYITFRNWLEDLYYSNIKFTSNDNTVFSFRLNRPINSRINTFVNCLMTKFILFQGKYIDFFSMPKVILTSLINDYEVQIGKNGFLFDVSLLNHLRNKDRNYFKKEFLPFIPVLCLPRKSGKSSWKGNLTCYFLEIWDQLFFMTKNLFR